MTDNKGKRGKEKMETDLGGHFREGKELKPPFARIPNMQSSSWKDDRMPEVLWAVLAIGNWERDKALAFFRHIGKFVEKNHECYDVTLSGIAKLNLEKRIEIINHIVSWTPETKELLRALVLFPLIPAFNEWKAVLGEAEFSDANKIANGVTKTLWHQSQEATDCRWVKYLCRILGNRVTFARTIEGIEDNLRGVLEYPNFGDMTKIRPFIRSGEIAEMFQEDRDYSWSNHFWSVCHEKTKCIPLGSVEKQTEYDGEEWDRRRKFYFEKTIELRYSLIEHFLKTATTTAVDYRHEASFGFAFYIFYLFTEIILNRLDFSITGRLTLRSMVEAHITFAYLLKKDDPLLWKSYRGYGMGQAKLVYLKLEELIDKPECIDEVRMREIANEDVWQEFLSINLGHWDNTTLRDMSEEAGLKEMYDRYYGWSSGYIHANWAGVREVVYESCINPLHRLHRHPKVDYPQLTTVVSDALKLVNHTLQMLAQAYPSFEDRLVFFDSSKTPEQS